MSSEQHVVTADDAARLRSVADGSWSMRRGVTSVWLKAMRERGLICVEAACERNEWRTNYVLTPAGIACVEA
jgi:hypothetical protein